MTAVVGTPMDVTIEELAIEAFYPADEATALGPAGHSHAGRRSRAGHEGVRVWHRGRGEWSVAAACNHGVSAKDAG